MQAIEVEEHFHVQHAYITPRDLSYFKRNSTTVSRGRTPLNGLSSRKGRRRADVFFGATRLFKEQRGCLVDESSLSRKLVEILAKPQN